MSVEQQRSVQKMLFFWIILSLFHKNVYAGCDTDKILDLGDLSLRQTTSAWNTEKSLLPAINDHELVKGWYSLVHNGWQYVMTHSKTAVAYTLCSTYWPIYLPEPHPPLKDITEKPVTVKACNTDDLFPCSITYEVKIRNCDGVIQYFLPSTTTYAGYCFEKHSEVKDENMVLPAPTDVNLGDISVVPQLKFTKPTFHFLPHISFKCKFTADNQYFYSVYWYIGYSLAIRSLALPPKGPSQSMEDLELHEAEIINSSFGLGIEIKCGVRVSQAMDGLKTETVFSSVFFAGMKISNTTIYLDKNSRATIELKPTVPLGCEHPPRLGHLCGQSESLSMIDPSAEKCRWELANTELEQPDRFNSDGFKKCGVYLKSLNTTDIWDSTTVYRFEIVTIDYNYNDKTSFNLKLQLPETLYHKIWKTYKIPDIKVIVRNTESYKNKVCYSHIDPHMKTADQTTGYELQNHYGTYLMYRNKLYHIQVQIQTIPCWGQHQPTCACAVAVSAGRDVFMINMCGMHKYFGYPHCDEGGILEVVRVNENQYKIFTPIGTLITVNLYRSEKVYLNIDILMAPKDEKQTEGLCGYFDGNPDNDFVHSDRKTSSYSYHPDDFTRSWKIGENKGLKIENSLFQSKPNLKAWKEDNKYYCVCDHVTGQKALKSEAVCGASQYICDLPDSVTKTHCKIITNRKKRSLGNSYEKELERLMKLMEPVPQRGLVKREVYQTYTEKEARDICTNKINGSLAVTEYSDFGANSNPNVVIEECIYDVTVGGDIKLADVHLESVNTVVKNMMEKQPVYVANNTEKVEVFLENTCPGNCSGIGRCTKTGVCVCIDFYHGSDCSIDERDPLIIDDIEGGGLCDAAYSDEECTCFVIRSDNILEKYSCNVQTFKISLNGEETYVSSNASSGQFTDAFTGICCIPNNILGSQDVFVAKYNISISNNLINYGNEATMYVHNSRCQDMSLESDHTRRFTLKENYCFIDGYCFADNDMATSGCLACHSDVSIVSWTEHNPCRNGGNCTGEEFGYLCSCAAGYGGINCEMDIDECASVPCQNGGKCTDFLNGYNCTCVSGYDGLLCENDINECLSNPCQNGASCQDAVNGYNCTCREGFQGIHCEIDIDDCISNPCKNSYVCVDLVNGYRCQCRPGYQGNDCDIDINECDTFLPCQHEGTCTNTHGSYMCSCLEGYDGANCDIDIDECASSPCLNDGSCTDMINDYNCSCKDGFEDKNCGTDIDECDSNPCLNNGSCTDVINGYNCSCRDGFEDNNCETDIDECFSNPCMNNGTCTDMINGYNCSCKDGFEDKNCETDIDECASDPCMNDGSCTDMINDYNCSCKDGFGDRNCETDIDECVSNPCMNNGSCTDMINGYNCSCKDGFEDNNCGTDIDECDSNPCLNGGSCIDMINGYNCSCKDGFEDNNCETDIDECVSNPCMNNGSCTDMINYYNCSCKDGFEDKNCETDIDECASNPCMNNGSCIDMINDYTCSCTDGFEDKNCTTDIDECASNPCMNNGSCTDMINGYNCSCKDGFEHKNCETEIDECASSPCLNGGSCTDIINGYNCSCKGGFEDKNCETDIDECSSRPCLNGGSCTDMINDYNCSCKDGFEDKNCETDINECASSPCLNDGSCTDMINDYNCSCKDGFEDKNCETNIDECVSNPCMNNGSCTDMINGYNCSCKEGFEDKNCETDIDECASSPCLNGGSCTDMVNGYNCSCKDGFEDNNCETDIDDCVSSPCMNGGSCTDMINGYNCSCKDGFEDKNCETDTDDCVSAPCKNGGSCNDQVNGYSCSCQEGYDGKNCELAPITTSRKKTKKIPFDRAQANDLKLQKKVEYLEGKLKLQTEKKRYLAAKTELVKQKTLYYMAMSALAGKQSALQLNIPDE